MENHKKIENYYTQNNKQGNPDFYILGWESKEAQLLRFQSLVSTIDLNNKKILDVGCGTGNFLEFIMNDFNGFEYTGVDILQHMVDVANHKNLNGKFYCTDIFRANPFKKNQFDVVVASGIFNLNLGNNRDFLQYALQIFGYVSKNVIAFNLLHDISPNKEDKYYYFSPDDVISMINTHFKNEYIVNVITGYLPNDFTVICIKK